MNITAEEIGPYMVACGIRLHVVSCIAATGMALHLYIYNSPVARKLKYARNAIAHPITCVTSHPVALSEPHNVWE